jgi:hypothetical protein
MRNIPPEKRKHLDFDIFLKESLKDPLIKAEFDRQQPEFAVIQAIIDARVKKSQPSLQFPDLKKEMLAQQWIFLKNWQRQQTAGWISDFCNNFRLHFSATLFPGVKFLKKI